MTLRDPELVRTLALPLCKEHPPLSEWPDKNLIQGICPACGTHTGDDGKAEARVLKARRMVAER